MKRMIVFATLMVASIALAGSADAEEQNGRLGIAELVSAVRSELIESENSMREKYGEPLFITRELELEMNFIVKESTEIDGVVDFILVAVGAKQEYSETDIHTIRLQFETSLPRVVDVSYYDFPKVWRDWYVPGMNQIEADMR